MKTDALAQEIPSLEIEETKDGTPTLFVPSLCEHYHSVFGARTESEYIFIGQALRKWTDVHPGSCTVLEVGFGTGLNALLTLLEAETRGAGVLYHTFENVPLPLDLIRDMWQKSLRKDEWILMEKIHEADWNRAIPLSDRFTIFKHCADLLSSDLPPADVIYMDAFAPEKTPLLWTEDFLGKLYNAAGDGARFATYCAKGEIRRRLRRVGFRVFRTPGPPGGKREILTAQKDYGIFPEHSN